MTKFFKVTLVSLAVLAGATAANAGSSTGVQDFNLDNYLEEQRLNGGA